MQPVCLLTLFLLSATIPFVTSTSRLDHAGNFSARLGKSQGVGERCGRTAHQCRTFFFGGEHGRMQKLACLDDEGQEVKEGRAGTCWVPLDGMCESDGTFVSDKLKENGCGPGTTCTTMDRWRLRWRQQEEDLRDDLTTCARERPDSLAATQRRLQPPRGADVGKACSAASPCRAAVALADGGGFGFVEQELRCLDGQGKEVRSGGQEGKCWIPTDGLCFDYSEGCGPHARCDGVQCRPPRRPRQLGEPCDGFDRVCGSFAFEGGAREQPMECFDGEGGKVKSGRAGKCFIPDGGVCESSGQYAAGDGAHGCRPGGACDQLDLRDGLTMCEESGEAPPPHRGDLGEACSDLALCGSISYFSGERGATQELQCFGGKCLIPEGGACDIPRVDSQGCAPWSRCDGYHCEPEHPEGPRHSAPGHFVPDNIDALSKLGEFCDTTRFLCGSIVWMDLITNKDKEQPLKCYDESGNEVQDGRAGTCWIPAGGICKWEGDDASTDHEERGCKSSAACKVDDAAADTFKCEDFDTFAKHKGDTGETCSTVRPCATLFFSSATEYSYNKQELGCYGPDGEGVQQGQFGQCWLPLGGFCDEEAAAPGCAPPSQCYDYRCQSQAPRPVKAKRPVFIPHGVSGLGEDCDNVGIICGTVAYGNDPSAVQQLQCYDGNGKIVREGRAGKCWIPLDGFCEAHKDRGCKPAAKCVSADDASLFTCHPDGEFEYKGDTGDACGEGRQCGTVSFYSPALGLQRQPLACDVPRGKKEGRCGIPEGGFCGKDWTRGRSCRAGLRCLRSRCKAAPLGLLG